MPRALCALAMTHYRKCGGAGRCGERTERRQWRMKRSERVAAVKIGGVRRKAARKFWAPQQGHRPLRQCNKSCGETGRRGRRPPTRSIYYVRLQRAVFFPALCNIIPATFSPPFFPQKGLTAAFFWHTINILKRLVGKTRNFSTVFCKSSGR